ncbi:MAG TPA: hypothetical protein ENH12_07835 [Proteobacteria bacterium]|nr:hypothetical protein [Pseudomonadota bacterium]
MSIKPITATAILLSLFLYSTGFTETYVTWDTMEIDKCASAWLIKRFIDKEAVFKFIPKGELVTDGIPFDTPDSKFRRYHNMSTFESILKEYKIQDPALIHIGQIIHDIEVSYWAGRQVEGSEELEKDIKEIIKSSSSPGESFIQGFKVLDEMYDRIR